MSWRNEIIRVETITGSDEKKQIKVSKEKVDHLEICPQGHQNNLKLDGNTSKICPIVECSSRE